MKKLKQSIFQLIFFIISIFSVNFLQAEWQVLQSGTTQNLHAVQFGPQKDTVFVAGDNGTVLKTMDGGLTWQNIDLPITITIYGLHFFDTDTGLVVGQGGQIYRTRDGGQSWSLIASGVVDNLRSVAFAADYGICGATSQTILYSSDRGKTWSIAQSGFFGGGFNAAVMLSSEIGFVGGENSIFQPMLGSTINGGQNWNFNPFYLNNNEGKIWGLAFTDVNIGYAACAVWDGRGAIAKTSDGGSNWTSVIVNQAMYAVDFPISNASLVGYSVGAAGTIMQTYDAGTSWSPQNSPVSVTLRALDFWDLGLGYIVGDGGTILKNIDTGLVVLPQPNSGNVNKTDAYFLAQNYPNPFNPSTQISYYLLQSDFVEIALFDVTGRKLEMLVSENQSTGNHHIQFNAQNLSSGVYFYQLKTGNGFIEMRKMVLMR